MSGCFVHRAVLLSLAWVAFASSFALIIRAETQGALEYRVSRWTSENGLPQNTIRALLQSREGYLWIGTAYGVARYDGLKRFKVYTAELQIENPSDLRVWDILEDSEGTVWIRTNDGLVKYARGSFKSTRSQKEVPFTMHTPDGKAVCGSR